MSIELLEVPIEDIYPDCPGMSNGTVLVLNLNSENVRPDLRVWKKFCEAIGFNTTTKSSDAQEGEYNPYICLYDGEDKTLSLSLSHTHKLYSYRP